MKKIILTVALCISFIISIFAQNPSVEITINEITTTSFTCAFVPNSACNGYAIYAGTEGDAENWIPMVGSLENILNMWGVHCVGDTTFTWAEMTPNTTYVVYVLASGAENIIYTDTLRTLSTGGTGASIITLSVTNIGDTCATTTATPNDQTALFKDMIVTRALFEEQGASGISYMLQADQYVYYETDTWTWLSLQPGTDYYFVAIGMNANSEWGELATFPFTTTGDAGISTMTAPTFSIYPNPATDQLTLETAEPIREVRIFDLTGRLVLEDENTTILNVQSLQNGTYILQVQTENGTQREKFVKQ